MDVQFILDIYACAMLYCVLYLKGPKEMSELLRKACAEAKEGNANFKQQVRDIGNKFLKSVLRKKFMSFCSYQCENPLEKLYLFINRLPKKEFSF